jgi:hypothetical protein
VPALRVGGLLLQPAAVRQHEGAEFGRAGGAVDRAVEAVAHERRQVAGVVQMRVRDDDGVDARRFHGEARPVPLPQGLYPWNSPQSIRIRLRPVSTR